MGRAQIIGRVHRPLSHLLEQRRATCARGLAKAKTEVGRVEQVRKRMGEEGGRCRHEQWQRRRSKGRATTQVLQPARIDLEHRR